MGRKIEEQESLEASEAKQPSSLWTAAKLLTAAGVFYGALSGNAAVNTESKETLVARRLSEVGDSVPSYMGPLMNDLKARQKLFADTPPEEVKYWFEYTGPLQVSLANN